MNAINNDPMLERIDSAAKTVSYAAHLLRQGQEGKKDADLMGCTMNEAQLALELAMRDLRAVGAHC